MNRADYNFVVKYGEVTPDGVAVYDLNSRSFVYMNRFLRGILGLAGGEDIKSGDEVLSFVHPEDMHYVDHVYRELLSIGCIAPAEFRVKQPGGDTRFVSAEVLWLEESYTFALFVKDVTALRRHTEYVEKISAQKDTLLDMLLHNLSGPLYLSRDVLKILSAQNGQDGNAKRLMEIVTETTGQCIDIVQEFLVEEHTESIEVMVRKTRFNLVEKTAIVLELLKELNPGKDLSIHASLADPYIASDPVKFCQIIHNLLSNAIKYTPEQGKVAVEVEEKAGLVTISINDNGTGVPERLVPALFREKLDGEPGLRGERSRGMGLLLCGKLADKIGAKLHYQPGEAGGSVFSMELPVN